MEPGPSFAPIGTEASVRPSFEMSRRSEQSEPRTAFASLSVRVNSGFIALPLYGRKRMTTIRTVLLRPWLVGRLGLCAAAFLFASRPAFSMSQILSDTKQGNHAEADTEEGIQFAEAGNLAWADGELCKTVALAPGNAEFVRDFATVLAMEKKLDEPTSYFQQAQKIDPPDLVARRYLAAYL